MLLFFTSNLVKTRHNYEKKNKTKQNKLMTNTNFIYL